MYQNGTQSPFLVTIFVKLVLQLLRKLHLQLLMVLLTLKQLSKLVLTLIAFAGRLSFFWNAHNNVLEEVAKFRASRRIWAKVMKERFGAKNEKSMKLRFHTQTAGSMLTAQQPNNNIIRVALQTAAAVMGGTQSLHTNSRDEALALPTEESVMIALRTQQIVAYESGLADVIDPTCWFLLCRSYD